jgi:hypothetical protein
VDGSLAVRAGRHCGSWQCRGTSREHEIDLDAGDWAATRIGNLDDKRVSEKLSYCCAQVALANGGDAGGLAIFGEEEIAATAPTRKQK